MAKPRDGSPPSFKERLRLRKGLPPTLDEEDDEVLEEGTVVLHHMFDRKVTLHPGNIVKKSGKNIFLGEADALRVAKSAGLPVPYVYGTETTSNGKNHISMDYIEGQVLSHVWKELSKEEKKDISGQLRDILATMRSIPTPPETYIGACTGDQIRDTRVHFPYTAPSCSSEKEFNDYLLAGLFPQIPSPIYAAFSGRLCTNHRIVFTHADLSPRNIVVRDAKIVGIIDWEDAGWYPEYWEYVKFFQRSTTAEGDWRDYADDIFPCDYPDELVDYIALSKWQSP